jgi:hypothetical protein
MGNGINVASEVLNRIMHDGQAETGAIRPRGFTSNPNVS